MINKNDSHAEEDDLGLRDQMGGIDWWHRIDLGNGLVTPGKDRSSEKLRTLQIPTDLSGRSVLDIGTWDGFFAFECEKRGAARVIASDHWVWHNTTTGKQGFDLAHRVLHSKVEAVDLDLNDHSPESIGTFDLVLFLGVLYHLEDPMRGMRAMSSVASHQMILETHVDMLFTRRPSAAFYPTSYLSHDSSNWWGPNIPGVIAMLHEVGFSKVDIKYVRPLHKRAARAAYRRGKGTPFFRSLSQGRAVIHAFK